MKNLITAFAVLASLSATAQNEKKVKLNDSTQLTYAVASDGKTKEGLYAIKNLKSDGVLVQGNYKGNERTGTWYYFNENKQLSMRYSFDQKKLLYMNNDDLKDVSVNIISDDEDVKKNASAPLPLCPIEFFASIAASKIYVTNNSSVDLDAEVIAHVDADGNAKYTVSYKDDKGVVKKQKVTLNNDKFPITWIPSVYKNKPVESEFIVSTSIKGNVSNAKRYRWDN